MQIAGKKILILGGWGLVGSAISHELMKFAPSELIISSLRKHEAEEAVSELQKEYSSSSTKFTARWGNIFAREEWKDIDWSNVIDNPHNRKEFIGDIFNDLDESILKRMFLYNLITEFNPDIIIDCINTATGIAYLDIYSTTAKALAQMKEGNADVDIMEKIIASTYIPQLIRHVQIMQRAMLDAKVQMYFKVGTAGTGGMGFNIPYTHSEERPSRVLMSKTAVAGAQTLLLFILARTPNGPLIKEIKPTAAIAWKKIAFEEVKRRGKPIELVDMKLENALNIQGDIVFNDFKNIEEKNEHFKSVFIDTGENGTFSRAEFETISSLGQMEIVTPEEIATYLIYEIRGGNTGHDVINALDAATLGPTYRGGLLRSSALEKLVKLENKTNTESIAFELLGPPRLSKLLFEANIIKKISGSMHQFLATDSAEISKKAEEVIKNNDILRSQMLSVGLVVLLSDGKKYLRGKEVKIPVHKAEELLPLTLENINKWCYEGWIDLRASNFDDWKRIIKIIMEQSKSLPADDTSSRYTYTLDYWDNFETFNEGKIVAWIFENEDKGWRFKR
jgi:hypothetical protein